MAWRLAGSLVVLRDEARARWPGTTVWTIGDADHQDEASDHNPNAAGVVCAGDFLPDGGMDLAWFAERVVRSGHPALKYVIYNRRVWSRARAGEGWRPYRGDNPHADHVHVSVGTGPDGQSTGPYDDTSRWGLAEEDDVTPQDIDRIADAVHRRLSHTVHETEFAARERLQTPGTTITPDKALQYAWALPKGIYMRQMPQVLAELAELRGQVSGLAELVTQLAAAPPVELTGEQLAGLTAAVEAAARAPGEAVRVALAAAGAELAELEGDPS